MAAILIYLIIASIIIIVLTMTGLGAIGTILMFIFAMAIIAYVINKLMTIEDKLDLLLSQKNEKDEHIEQEKQ